MKITPKLVIISLYNFLILTLPLFFWYKNEELFEFNKMVFVYGLTVVISLAWIVRMILEKRYIFKRTPFDWAIIFFLFSQLVSTIFSIHPRTSLLGYYSRFHGGLLSTVSYIILFYGFASNFKKKDLGGFFLSSFISGLLVSTYGILEHFGHSASCLLITGGKSFGVDCWIQDVQSRVFATFGQPNWLAAYVITLFPISLIASIQKKLLPFKRVFFLITTFSLFLVLLYTRSRSGMFGLASGIVVLLISSAFVFLKDKKNFFKNIHTSSLLIITTIILGVTLISGTALTPNISDIFNKFSNQNTVTETKNFKFEEGKNSENNQIPAPVANRLELGGTDSGEIRKIVWEGAFKVWQRYPIIGSGVETFAYSYYQDRIQEHNNVSEWDFLYNKAHNELLNFMATTGTIGLLTYLSLFATLGIVSFKLLGSQIKPTEKLIISALIAGQTALFISNFFGFSTVAVSVLMYCHFAIISIFYTSEKDSIVNKKQSKETKYILKDGWQYFALTLVSIIALIFIYRVYNYWAADKAYAQGKAYFNSNQFQYGVQQQLDAIKRSPNEALYFDTLSDNYAKLAVHFASINQATAAAQIANETVAASDQVMKLNNRHLNFYKTRARVFVTLSQLDERYLEEAKRTLLQARELSPTDPKLIYTLAVIEQTSGNLDLALEMYEQAILLKPNYERPYWKISEIYETKQQYEKAIPPLQYILENLSPENEEVIEKIKLLEEKSS